jgi:hypothetical protein
MVSNLQRKIGKLFREGGTYRRVLPSGDTLTFDVLRFGARINVPADKRWVTRATADVTITLTCQALRPRRAGDRHAERQHRENTTPRSCSRPPA